MESLVPVRQIVEGLLFASDQPLSPQQLAEVLELPVEEIRAQVAALREEYARQQRALTILEVAGGFQMATTPEVAPWIRKCYRQAHKERLSKPALETLAIMAYKQPLTRAEIEAIRGVNVDGVVESLLEKNLIRIMGRKDAPGRPMLYGTTKEFLQYFGLNALADLPQLAEVNTAEGVLAQPTSQAAATAPETAPEPTTTHESADLT